MNYKESILRTKLKVCSENGCCTLCLCIASDFIAVVHERNLHNIVVVEHTKYKFKWNL